MTIWILAVLLLGSLAGLGYRQGVIRVGFSLIGIFAACLLAGPIGKLIKMFMVILGVKNLILLGILPPVIGFILVSLAFKAGALPVHHKVDVHFKYQVSELRLALWERVHRKLGLCLGIFNGVAYFTVISWVIYALSYWTVQAETPDQDPWVLKLFDRLGHDLDQTGFVKVARAVDPLPDSYYQSADVAGLIYNNPLREARLSHYPAFLGLAERPEFQELGNDKTFKDMRLRRDPLLSVYNHPTVQKVLENHDLVEAIRAALIPNLKDLEEYLVSGKSDKFDSQKILGVWNFDLAYTMVMVRRAYPNLTANEMMRRRREDARIYAQTTFIATPEHEAILKGAPQTGKGQWQETGDGKYQVSVASRTLTGAIESERLTLRGEGFQLAFLKED